MAKVRAQKGSRSTNSPGLNLYIRPIKINYKNVRKSLNMYKIKYVKTNMTVLIWSELKFRLKYKRYQNPRRRVLKILDNKIQKSKYILPSNLVSIKPKIKNVDSHINLASFTLLNTANGRQAQPVNKLSYGYRYGTTKTGKIEPRSKTTPILQIITTGVQNPATYIERKNLDSLAKPPRRVKLSKLDGCRVRFQRVKKTKKIWVLKKLKPRALPLTNRPYYIVRTHTIAHFNTIKLSRLQTLYINDKRKNCNVKPKIRRSQFIANYRSLRTKPPREAENDLVQNAHMGPGKGGLEPQRGRLAGVTDPPVGGTLWAGGSPFNLSTALPGLTHQEHKPKALQGYKPVKCLYIHYDQVILSHSPDRHIASMTMTVIEIKTTDLTSKLVTNLDKAAAHDTNKLTATTNRTHAALTADMPKPRASDRYYTPPTHVILTAVTSYAMTHRTRTALTAVTFDVPRPNASDSYYTRQTQTHVTAVTFYATTNRTHAALTAVTFDVPRPRASDSYYIRPTQTHVKVTAVTFDVMTYTQPTTAAFSETQLHTILKDLTAVIFDNSRLNKLKDSRYKRNQTQRFALYFSTHFVQNSCKRTVIKSRLNSNKQNQYITMYACHLFIDLIGQIDIPTQDMERQLARTKSRTRNNTCRTSCFIINTYKEAQRLSKNPQTPIVLARRDIFPNIVRKLIRLEKQNPGIKRQPAGIELCQLKKIPGKNPRIPKQNFRVCTYNKSARLNLKKKEIFPSYGLSSSHRYPRIVNPLTHDRLHGNPLGKHTSIHRYTSIRATSVNHSNKGAGVTEKSKRLSIMEDQVEPYDPEFPQGRPEKKSTLTTPGRLPFTGYFDQASQSYVIDNFDDKLMQIDSANNTQIVVAGQGTQQPQAMTPISQQTLRTNEIRQYFAGTQLRAQTETAGIVPWFQPVPGYSTSNYRRQTRDPRRKPIAGSLPMPTVGGPWMNSHLETGFIAHNPYVQDPTSSYQAQRFSSLGCTIRAQRQDKPNERTGRIAAKPNTPASTTTAPAGPIASTTPQKVEATKRTAKSAVTVDPIALAEIPVHAPSMERLTRQEQLKKQSLLGQFVKSAGIKKPKGSINIPRPVQLAAKLTNVPTAAWPRTGHRNPSQNMWTAALAKTASPGRPLAPPLHMLTLLDLTRFKHEIRPISPLPTTPPRKTINTVQKSLPQDNIVLNNSVHLDLTNKQDTLSTLPSCNSHPSLAKNMSESEMDLDATFIELKGQIPSKP